jgi:sodium transport system permease protein
MRLPIALTIFRKELVETLRDRRTLFMMVGLPILLYPMLIIAFSWFSESQSEAREERRSAVAVWGSAPAPLLDALDKGSRVTLHAGAGEPEEVARGLQSGTLSVPAPAKGDDRAGKYDDDIVELENPVLTGARQAVASRAVDVVLVVWPGFSAAVQGGGLGEISVYYDSLTPNSVKALDRVRGALERYRRGLVGERERRLGLPAGFARTVGVMGRNVATERRRAGDLLGSLLPFLLITMSLLGAFYPAIDLTAGEKERGTMQTLMCAPVRSTEIIFGKFLAVWAMSLVAALANVASLAFTMGRVLPGRSLSVPASAYVFMFVMLVPVTFIISALFLAVAAFAKGFKDGQNFLTPVYTLLVMPAALTMLPAVDLSSWSAFVPVLNIAGLIKAALRGDAAPHLVFLVLLSSTVYAALAVLLAARVFEQEQVLLGGEQPVRQILGLQRRQGGVPSSMFAICGFAAMLVLVFYGSLLLERRGILVTLLATEYAFFLLPTLAVVLGLGFSARETLSLQRPSMRAVAGSVLLGLSAWTFAVGVLVRLLPPPDSLVRSLERLLLLDNRQAPLWVVWLVIGLTPAVCEELFFRGFVFAGLRRLGIWWAIVLSALMFGLAHSSVYRLLPTFFLGLLFGLAVWRSGSVATSIIAHALNNGLMATIALSPAFARALGMGQTQYLPWAQTLAGCAVLALAVWLIWGDRGGKEAARPGGDPGGENARAGREACPASN